MNGLFLKINKRKKGGGGGYQVGKKSELAFRSRRGEGERESKAES